MLWTQLVRLLILLLGPVIGDILSAGIKRVLHSGIDEDFMGVLLLIVQGLGKDHPDLDDDTKRKMAYEAAKAHALSRGLEVADSVINQLIEHVVAKLKDPTAPSPKGA